MTIAIIPPGSQFNAQEQTMYGLVFVPPRPNNPVLTNWSSAPHSKYGDGFININSFVSGGQIKFYFRGRRIGVAFGRLPSGGKIALDVDGTAYPTVDTSLPAGAAAVYGGQNAYIIDTNLVEGDHVLTITKTDAFSTNVHGFFVDSASASQYFTRSAPDYQQALAGVDPIAIGTTDTAVRTGLDYWMLNGIITNTTASPINVTLKNNAGTAVIGPFPVPSNDFRVIPGPIFFNLGMKAVASATGCNISVGGQ